MYNRKQMMGPDSGEGVYKAFYARQRNLNFVLSKNKLKKEILNLRFIIELEKPPLHI